MKLTPSAARAPAPGADGRKKRARRATMTPVSGDHVAQVHLLDESTVSVQLATDTTARRVCLQLKAKVRWQSDKRPRARPVVPDGGRARAHLHVIAQLGIENDAFYSVFETNGEMETCLGEDDLVLPIVQAWDPKAAANGPMPAMLAAEGQEWCALMHCRRSHQVMLGWCTSAACTCRHRRWRRRRSRGSPRVAARISWPILTLCIM